eukprot:GFUD01011453.1.p1 GENE.GFUD01011453.1~~GFUD01011453.1.p1  ORF type:complete len:228 (-),score=64.47 GFUD01011453.1:46-729(-)
MHNLYRNKGTMEDINGLDLEQKKFYVTTSEFQEKFENFQNRFHWVERANKVSVIRLLVVFLIVLVVVIAVGCLWYRQDTEASNSDLIDTLVKTVASIEDQLEQEKKARENLEIDLKKEEEKRKSLEKVLTQTYSLLGGSNSKEGNIYVNGRPVCDDEWDLKDATVACKSLGFKNAVKFTAESAFGSVADNFIMDDVKCDGTENSLLGCKYDKTDDCTSKEGAGVVCS